MIFPNEVKNDIDFIFVNTIDDVIDHALQNSNDQEKKQRAVKREKESG